MRTTTQISPRFTMLPEEWKVYWEGFISYFLLPLALMYLTETSAKFTINGFDWTDFIPDNFLMQSMFGLLFAQLISLFKKYVPKNIVTTTTATNEKLVTDTILLPDNPDSPTVIDTTILK